MYSLVIGHTCMIGLTKSNSSPVRLLVVKQGSTLRVNLWPQASKNSQKQFRASKTRLQLVLQAQ